MSAGGRAVLQVEGLVAGYGGAPVLKGLDLVAGQGTITAVLGANGAGKTTLLRTLSSLVRRSAGDVRLDGHEVARSTPVEQLVRRGMAHVPEGRGVIGELTVDENLRLGGLWLDDAASIVQIYELFPALAQRRAYLGHQLSGGERQMLALGRALVSRPRLLLLDEPSLGLAPKVVAQIMALLARLRDERGLTVLLVEQNVRSALSVADRAMVMALGRVVAEGTADELRDKQDLRHAYLGF
jgi:branched-chain amino acid transport system ATP-binding protein